MRSDGHRYFDGQLAGKLQQNRNEELHVPLTLSLSSAYLCDLRGEAFRLNSLGCGRFGLNYFHGLAFLQIGFRRQDDLLVLRQTGRDFGGIVVA